MNVDRKAGALGRQRPHPKVSHPRVLLENHVNFAALPPAPAVVDWCSKVQDWPMYWNDQLGDCTCAAIGHQIQAWTAYANSEVDVTDQAVLNLYEAMGYVPNEPWTDQGANIQDVLQYVVAKGVEGYKYLAFAEINNLHNMNNVYAALDLFGSVYLGINCPDSAMTQFEDGQPWSYVNGATIEGGHAIVLQKKNEDKSLDIITWGAVQPMEQSFWDAYVEEAWVVVTEQWFNDKTKETPTGLNLEALMADFKAVNG